MTKSAFVVDAEERLRRIGRSIDRLIEKAHIVDSADTARSEVARELKRIDDHVAATRAQIAQDLALTRKDLSIAVGDELDLWKGRLQDLGVQAALGRMEVRDRLEPVMKRIDLSIDRVRNDIEELGHGEVIDQERLEHSVRMSMRDLRQEIDAAEELH